MTKASNKQLSRIECVNPVQDINQSQDDGQWGAVVRTFSPLGIIAESYAKTLAYKIETKRLEIELSRINRQAENIHHGIDKTYNLKMEELEHRRMSLLSFYKTVNSELERLHIERETVLEMAKMAQNKAFESNICMEERQLYKEMALEMVREIPNFGDKSNESLQKLVQALPPVEITSKILEG